MKKNSKSQQSNSQQSKQHSTQQAKPQPQACKEQIQFAQQLEAER